MRSSKLFLGLLGCTLMCACSEDALDKSPNVFTANDAYISVKLADVGSVSTRGTDGGYEYGVANEHAVKNAHFYFYDENGLFVSKGSAWNGGTEETGTPAGNVEFRSNTIIVLKGLKDKSFPKYMVTLLNQPAGFSAPQTLDEMEAELVDDVCTKVTENGTETSYFTMSTSSYVPETADDAKYFVTEITEENLSTEPVAEPAEDELVTVYVERLAAKVTLNVGQSLSLSKVSISGKDGDFYKIESTVAGDDNIESDNIGNIAAEELYVQFLGWKLNGTANKSYVVKNIDKTWTETGLGFAWNKPADFRSFWGKSFNYGDADMVYTNQVPEGKTCPLNYVTLESDLVNLGASSYCAENTNTAAILNTEGNFPAAVTSILLKAQVCGKDGNPLDLVRFNGILFTVDQFKAYIVNVLEAENKWNVWTKSGEAYTQLDENSVELVSNGDGSVYLQLDVDGSTTLYSKNATGDNEFTALTDVTAINTNLKTESGAVAYTNGEMYYNIPIEHLNPIETTQTALEEANYGIVRNHHYVVTIDKLEKLGKGIFDPEEVIIPTEEEDDTYYIGAKINILSWKVVNQSVEL